VQPLQLEFAVACSPKHAFDVWAKKTSLWWPRTHSISGAPETVTFEPHAGGRIFERTAEGIEHDWGEVLAWEPPHRISYLWHIYGDRRDATEPTQRRWTSPFAQGDGTSVSIVHRRVGATWSRGPRPAETKPRGLGRASAPLRTSLHRRPMRSAFSPST
jgi:uncharacterized protein YndB with AHSA1/START domain